MGVICNTPVDVIGSVNILHVRVQSSYTILHRIIIVTLNVFIRFVFVINTFVFWEERKNLPKYIYLNFAIYVVNI